MRRTLTAIATTAGLVTALALPGCIFIDGSSSGSSSYRGYGSTTKAQLDAMVAANTQNRIGEPSSVVLGRFPAEHISLGYSSVTPGGSDLAVYKVFAREKTKGTRFERYLVFENDRLVLLTDDEDYVETHYEHRFDLDLDD